MAPAAKKGTKKSADEPTYVPKSYHESEKHEAEIEWFAAITTYLGYAVLTIFGHIRDFFGKRSGHSRYFNTRPPKGYAPLLQDWENFYTRRLYHRIHDCWNRPIDGPPFANALPLILRNSKDGNVTMDTMRDEKGKYQTKTCINLGSYNYLGFADDWETTCKQPVMDTASKYPMATCTSFIEGGYSTLHRALEKSVAEFVGKEDAIIYNMGWATNFLGIPSLIGEGCLIISDSLNHNSIVSGARTSGATVRVFKHNDLIGLESLIRNAIVEGQEKKRCPWKKILVAVEGIYSMEGQIVDLKGVVDIAKKYRCYVYLDEAHSIGAMGPNGKGVCEHYGVDPKDVDILMGTFTKSFGAMGGYIAGSTDFIRHIRQRTAGFLLDNAMSPIVCQQILTAFAVMKGEDGTTTGKDKIARLRDNANFFRKGLLDIGVEIMGQEDSPIIPMMLYNPTKIAAFSRECLVHGLAVVVVGFPATPVVMSRARFCLSAGHTREQLERALKIVDIVATKLKLKYRKSVFG